METIHARGYFGLTVFTRRRSESYRLKQHQAKSSQPDSTKNPDDCANRFYAYGVVARLANLAAAREQSRLGEAPAAELKSAHQA